MRLCPDGGNDVVYTPDNLASLIVSNILEKYPDLRGSSVLEPCAGGGAFVRALQQNGLNPKTCEITQGVDFLEYQGVVDWIVTNPPWSKIKLFLQKSCEVSNDFFFLAPIPNLMTKARLREVHKAGFKLVGLWLVDTPKEFPQSGFQLAVGHFSNNEQLCSIIEKLRI